MCGSEKKREAHTWTAVLGLLKQLTSGVQILETVNTELTCYFEALMINGILLVPKQYRYGGEAMRISLCFCPFSFLTVTIHLSFAG
jgi:hypothetical protein